MLLVKLFFIEWFNINAIKYTFRHYLYVSQLILNFTHSLEIEGFHSDITGFANESVMIDKLHAMCGDYLCGIIGGVVFSNLPRDGDTLPTHVRYKIRMRSEGSVSARYSVLPYLKYPSCRRREKGGECCRKYR